jgi:hypothetical protein
LLPKNGAPSKPKKSVSDKIYFNGGVKLILGGEERISHPSQRQGKRSLAARKRFTEKKGGLRIAAVREV